MDVDNELSLVKSGIFINLKHMKPALIEKNIFLEVTEL